MRISYCVMRIAYWSAPRTVRQKRAGLAPPTADFQQGGLLAMTPHQMTPAEEMRGRAAGACFVRTKDRHIGPSASSGQAAWRGRLNEPNRQCGLRV